LGFVHTILKEGAGNGLWHELLHCHAKNGADFLVQQMVAEYVLRTVVY
jgi:hypothetical protein